MNKKYIIILAVTAVLAGGAYLFSSGIFFGNESQGGGQIVQEMCMAQSDILGVAFDYPCEWGVFSEKVDQPNPRRPHETWQSTFGRPVHFIDSADNEKTANFIYEGIGPLFAYYGQPLENLCEDETFVDPYGHYDLEEFYCEKRTNDHGFEYVAFEAVGISLIEYGFDQRDQNPLVKMLAPPSAFAQSYGDVFREAGVAFPTKSEKWPGMSLISHLYDFPDNERKDKYPIGKEQVEKLVPTLRYIRE